MKPIHDRLPSTPRVLREIWLHEGIAPAQIVERLGLGGHEVGEAVAHLLDRGLIVQGAAPDALLVNGSYGRVLGVEIRPEGYAAVAADLDGRLIGSWSGGGRVTGANLRESVLQAIATVRGKLGPGAPLLGVGVGLPGVVDHENGVIRFSIPLRIDDPWSFCREVAQGYDLPILVENNANACALGEIAFRKSTKLRDFLFVLAELRTIEHQDQPYERIAVGMGLVIGGRLHHGRSFSAGEFRSVLCGRDHGGQFAMTDEEATRVADDPVVRERFVRELARNVALLVNTLNLDHVIIGGDIERYRRQIAIAFAEEIQRNWPYPEEARCEVAFASLGAHAVAFGAAGTALHRLFAELRLPGLSGPHHGPA